MKKLKFKNFYYYHYEYVDDIERIIKVFADRGYEISESDALCAWKQYSQNIGEVWMCLNEDDESVFQKAFYYFYEVIDENDSVAEDTANATTINTIFW